MAKKKETGRKREMYGFQIITSELGPGNWHVLVYAKRPGDTIEKDGFEFEGLGIDWAEDWCHEHRAITHKIKFDEEEGHVAFILDHDGREIQRLRGRSSPDAATRFAFEYIGARRLHDLELIRERQKNRANFRMEMQDLDDRDAHFDKVISDAKDAKKKIEDKRSELKAGLHSPQVVFNFVSSKSPEEREQLDIEDTASRRRDPRTSLRSVKGGGGEQPEANSP